MRKLVLKGKNLSGGSLKSSKGSKRKPTKSRRSGNWWLTIQIENPDVPGSICISTKAMANKTRAVDVYLSLRHLLGFN